MSDINSRTRDNKAPFSYALLTVNLVRNKEWIIIAMDTTNSIARPGIKIPVPLMTVEECVELGLPDGPLDPYEETDPFFPRIGGKPTWLGPSYETEKGLLCGVCGSSLYLLLQMDCPPAQRSANVDRIFYIFACNSRECTESGESTAVKVLVQCRRTTKPMLPAKQPQGLWDSVMVDQVAVEMGMTSLDEDPQGFYSSDYPCGFPPVALHIVDELIAMHHHRDVTMPNLETEVIDETSQQQAESWQAEMYEKMLITGYDKVFKNFHTRVAHYPRQCVRFSPGGNPLPFSSEDIPEIPPCSKCKKNRHFELQLMPAILSKLPTNQDLFLGHIPKGQRGKHPLFGDGMEWGTIMVYGCGQCDEAENGVWQYEGFAVIQIEKDSY